MSKEDVRMRPPHLARRLGLGWGSTRRRMHAPLVLTAILLLVACHPRSSPPQQVQGYRLETELPRTLPQQVPSYRVLEPRGSERDWARRVAAALGFSGDPVAEGHSAAQPEWTWAGPERDEVLTVNGSIAYQCSFPPAGAAIGDAPKTGEEAMATAKAWLTVRGLLPPDCADDVQTWRGADGLGWEVRFRRRLDGLPVGSYWSWTGGLLLRLNSQGRVDFRAPPP